MAFVNLSRYLDANKDELENEGQQALGEAEPKLNAAESGLAQRSSPTGDMAGDATGKVVEGAAYKNMLDNSSGRAGLLMHGHAKQGGYGYGMAAFDSALAGGSNAMQQADSRYGNLMSRLDEAEKTRAQRQQQNDYNAQVSAGKARQAGETSYYQAPKSQPYGSTDAGDKLSTEGPVGGDPNAQSDEQLNAAGYMYSPAPGESYAHYSDRVSKRNGVS